NSESRSRLSDRELWQAKLTRVQIGMDKETLHSIIRGIRDGTSFDVEECDGCPGKAVYRLDSTWKLHVEYSGGKVSSFTLVPYRRGWKPLSELRAEIGDNFFSTLELVNQSPRVNGTAFDPAALIRAVNELHACGKDGALQALSAYQLLARKDP